MEELVMSDSSSEEHTEEIESLFHEFMAGESPQIQLIPEMITSMGGIEAELELATVLAFCSLNRKIAIDYIELTSPGQAACRKTLNIGVDVGWKCLDCELDETSIICAECYENGPHRNHRAILRNRVSGCCDCGDPCAWKTEGNCSLHQGITKDFIARSVDCLPPMVKKAFTATVAVIYTLIILDGQERKQGWQDRNNARITWLTKQSNVGPALMHLVASEMLKSYPVTNKMKAEYRKLDNIADLATREEILEHWDYEFECEEDQSYDSCPLDIIIKFCHHMPDHHRTNIEDLFMAVLSDPDWKVYMTVTFMKHYELLLKTMQDGYNLIRYSVQIFTAEDMALIVVKNSELIERALGLLCLFMAKAYQEETEHSDISQLTYDAIWNQFINFQYLLSKPSAAEIALKNTSLLSNFARAAALVYRFNAIEPRTSHLMYDSGSFKSK